ncbi:MAG: hypothetical protein EBU36_01270 [Verrucomicrobia bacterium]|nr:hypothetical protein [Verrucomicrobiota bacterium]
MVQGGDRGFLFRTTGLGILVMGFWKILESGGILAGGDQLLPNREAMAHWAPVVVLGMFFLRGPLPVRKSFLRAAGFQFLNLGFLGLAALYGLAAVPLRMPPCRQRASPNPKGRRWRVGSSSAITNWNSVDRKESDCWRSWIEGQRP